MTRRAPYGLPGFVLLAVAAILVFVFASLEETIAATIDLPPSGGEILVAGRSMGSANLSLADEALISTCVRACSDTPWAP